MVGIISFYMMMKHTFKSINRSYGFNFKLDLDENMKIFSCTKPCLEVEISKV